MRAAQGLRVDIRTAHVTPGFAAFALCLAVFVGGAGCTEDSGGGEPATDTQIDTADAGGDARGEDVDAAGSDVGADDVSDEEVADDTGEEDAGDTADSSDAQGVCGDGVRQVDAGEACDGDDLGDETCSSLGFEGGQLACDESCRYVLADCEEGPGSECGDGVRAGSEECDGVDFGDASCESMGAFGGSLFCTSSCRIVSDGCIFEAGCGNAIVEEGEECDDGNRVSGDGCTDSCALEFCGDGVRNDAGREQCDDGNDESGDGCSPDCQLEFCGDGEVQDILDEACDDGEENSDEEPDACRTDCTLPTCGDGVTDTDEECDDGNDESGDGCSAECVEEFCGDGILHPAIGEECDLGDENSDAEADACRTDCRPARCGDGVIDSDEECDDDNRTSGDGCNATCIIEFCGDGVMQPDLGELCDEGDANSDEIANRCRTDCTPARCGDAVEDIGEECDDGNDVSGDGCAVDCTEEFCGDGVVQAAIGEECDDENSDETDGCTSDCLACEGDDAEPDNALSFATTLEPGEGEVIGRTATGADEDWFLIGSCVVGSATVTVETEEGSQDAIVQLVDMTTSEIVEEVVAGPGSAELVVDAAELVGQAVIIVAAVDRTGCSRYRLAYENDCTGECFDDGLEDNDSVESPYVVFATPFIGTALVSLDRDVFEVPVCAGGRLEAALTSPTGAPLDSRVEIDGAEVASAGGASTRHELRAEVGEDEETAYVIVDPAEPDAPACVAYRLEVNDECGCVGVGGGIDQDSAEPLPPTGGVVAGQRASADGVWYRLAMCAGGSATFAADSLDGEMTIARVGVDGAVIDSATGMEPTLSLDSPSEAGTVWLHASSSDVCERFVLNAEVRDCTCNDDAAGEDDLPEDATTWSPAPTYWESYRLEAAGLAAAADGDGDADWYEATICPGGAGSVEVRSVPSFGDVELVAFDEDGVTIGRSSGPDNMREVVPIANESTAAMLVRFRVVGLGDDQCTPYRAAVSVEGCDVENDDREIDDSIEDANTIDALPAEITGGVVLPGDVDYFALPTCARDGAAVELTHPIDDPTPQLDLLDASGAIVARAAPGGEVGELNVSATAEDDGPVAYVVVRSSDGDRGTGYVLRVDSTVCD